MGLPYDMGNAGDLLKHGVLAEFVRWQCEMGPFNEFLPRRAPAVVPQMTAMAERAAVMLFALNLDPRNPIGRRFDALLEEYLRGAWRMTCPPLRGTASGARRATTRRSCWLPACCWIPRRFGRLTC